jgi:CheY-like chemotaxis protein
MGLTPLCADDEQGARAHVRDAGRNLYALVVDSVVVAAQLPALVMRLRDAMALRDVKVILLLPAGVAVAQDMVFDAMVLKPVKRGELYAALIGTQSLPDADSAGRVAGIDGSREAARGQVLLVDDNPMNVQVAQSMLQRLSLAVDTANSGEQALQCLADHAYDVVLMDEQMPGMDGLETTRLLRERERRDEGEQRHTIVVALTANADSEAQQRCLAAGMDGFLAKPVRRKALRAMLAGWIANLPVDDG